MVKRLASADEVNAAMSDPDDIHNASNTAYFFVVFRLSWYIICSVASMVAVIMLAIENANMLAEFKDIQAVRSNFLDKRVEQLTSLCAFEYLAIPRAAKDAGKPDIECPRASSMAGSFTENALAPSDSTTLRCNLVTGVLSTSVAYGLIMTVITGMLLFNKKVKVSQSIIIELAMAGTLAILSTAMASLVTSSFRTSCSDCITMEDWDYDPTCQEWAVITNYNMRTGSPDATTGYGAMSTVPWYTNMSGLQDGLWATAIGWTVLTIMLRIRFKNARSVAKSPEFNNTVQDDDYGLVEAPKGANAQAQDPQASPAPSYHTNDSAPPPAPAVQGNPFA